MKFKLGIDIHGVLDKEPKFYVSLAKMIKKSGGEIHIITGQSWSNKLESQLLYYNCGIKWWDVFFSIDDDLYKHYKTHNLEIHIDEKGGRTYDEYLWNSSKGKYCNKHKINLMFDDSPFYGQYFKIGYIKIGSRKKEGQRFRDTISVHSSK